MLFWTACLYMETTYQLISPTTTGKTKSTKKSIERPETSGNLGVAGVAAGDILTIVKYYSVFWSNLKGLQGEQREPRREDRSVDKIKVWEGITRNQPALAISFSYRSQNT